MTLKTLAALLLALTLGACRAPSELPQAGEAFAEVSLFFNT